MDSRTANATRNQVNVYQPRKPASDIVVRYAFLHGEDSDYSGMARYYQKYLVKTGELDRLDMSGGVPLVLDLVGAIDVRTPVLGAPRDIVVPLTTFRQAASIVDELVDSGIARIDVRYSGWMKGGLRHVLPSGVAVERSLGTKRDLEDLADKLSSMGIGFYPDVSFLRVYRDTWFDGFTWLRDAARMLNRSASRVSGYDTVTGELLTDLISSPYVLSARRLGDLVTSFAREYARYSIPGLSLRDMASQVDSDFRTDEDLLIDRAQSLKIVEEQLRYLSDDVGLGLMASGANDYAIKYCDIVTDVPTGSSGYQILDETVPFFQMVLHGYVAYALEPANLAVDPVQAVLRTIETGASPYFRVMYADGSTIKSTRYDHLYSMNFHEWKDDIIELYRELNEVFSAAGGHRIVQHRRILEGVYQTIYENGASTVVNYTEHSVDIGGHEVRGCGYIVLPAEVTQSGDPEAL